MNIRGFTLLEVLIALVVFAVMFMGVYALLNQSLFVNRYANNRLSLILASSEFLYLHWDTPPSETSGWVDVNGHGVGEFRVDRTPTVFKGVVRVDWSFRKGNAEIGYELYY